MSGRLYDTLISLWFRKETHGAGPYCTTARSYNPIFSQFLVQGSPADAEYPGCTGTVALRLFKGPEKQLFSFSSGMGAVSSRPTARSRFSSSGEIHPSAESRTARWMQFLSSRMLPGQGYFCNEAAARLLNPRTGLRCFSEKCFTKNSASGRMSSPHSERGGTLMVNSFRRWNRSSRKRPSDIALSRFSFVAATRRTSKVYSWVEPTGL